MSAPTEFRPEHSHVFLGAAHRTNEKRTWVVVGLTGATMIIEVVAGLAFGSMALLADGFHMATHAGALAISALAYRYARKHADDRRFSFGTGKLGELAAFSSALILAVIALLIGYESFLRLAEPISIAFDEAIAVAILGFMVNILCVWLLRGPDHHHGHAHSHTDGRKHHHHGHDDHNLRAAYLHVITDAMTSILAIAGLLAGRFYGWMWLDPVMGVLGAIVIARWSWLLLKQAGAVLLDTMPDDDCGERIRELLERDGDRVTDLHLWRVGPGHVAAVISLESARPMPPSCYKERISAVRHLSHITVEVQPAGPASSAA